MVKPTISPSLDWKTHLPFQPWIYFLTFLTANILLSYFSFSLEAKLWIILAGLFLPFGIALKMVLKERKTQKASVVLEKDLLTVTPWLWVLFGILLLVTRFWSLTTLPFWPLSDEGIMGFISLGLAHHWSWNLLWTDVGLEPMAFWLLGLYFKIIQPSLISFRLFSALVSLATPFAAYWAARQYFPRLFAFLFAWLVAFSFWEFSLARLCVPPVLCPFFQCLCFGFLGLHLKTNRPWMKWGSLGLLALLGGAGFYIWTVWATTWLAVAVLLLVNGLLKGRRDIKDFLFFSLFSILPVLPLVSARLSAGGMSHIQENFTPFLFRPLVFYLKGVFWDGSSSFPYGSNWGGFFNPVLGALAFIGLLHFLKTVPWRLTASLVLSLILAFLPGALTKSVELYRVLLSFPLLTLLAAGGLGSLLPISPKKAHWFGIATLMAVSFFLDVNNYIYHYCDSRNLSQLRQWRNVEYYDAYNILRSLSVKEGPLYLFSEFNTDYDNKTLDVACYPFNIIQNTSLSISKPRWVVLITNVQFAPYFIKNFPGLKLKVLRTDKTEPANPKPFGIFLIPSSQIPASMLENWKKADEIYRNMDFQMKSRKSVELWTSFMEAYPFLPGQFKKDHFLTAVYWEKMGFFKFLDGYFIQATEAYRKAINQGIPAAHLYYNLGVCLKIQNHLEESENNFKKATALSQEVH